MRRAAGFTLLELLVAMAIFAILGTLAYSGLRNVIDAGERTEETLEELGRLQILFRRLGSDLEQSVERGVRDEWGDPRPALAGGDGALVELTTALALGPLSEERGTLQRVAWLLDGDRLLRRRWRDLDRGRDARPEEAVLLEGVTGAGVQFLAPDDRWVGFWPPEEGAGLPRAVRFELELEGWGRLERWFVLPARPAEAPA